MRRLGIFLGLCGGILGGCFAYSGGRAAWDAHTAYRRFESVMASPTMQRVAKAAREYQVDEWGGRRITTGEVTYDDQGHVMRETRQQATAQDWFDRNAPKSAAVMRATKQQATARADKWEQYVQPIPGDQQPWQIRTAVGVNTGEVHFRRRPGSPAWQIRTAVGVNTGGDRWAQDRSMGGCCKGERARRSRRGFDKPPRSHAGDSRQRRPCLLD
jgi:hypothetical protein